jgi:hypothetical protein
VGGMPATLRFSGGDNLLAIISGRDNNIDYYFWT